MGVRRWSHGVALAAGIMVLLVACGGDDNAVESQPAIDDPSSGADGQDGRGEGDGTDGDDSGDEGSWFSIDESVGTVTIAAHGDPARGEEVTAPIVADGTWTIDGDDFEFVVFNVGVNECPVPASGASEDIRGFRGVGHSPDGRPFNVNAGAPDLAISTTWDADWRSTNTAHDDFGPDWTIGADELRIDDSQVKDVEAGERVPSSLLITCR